jgi:hypothetical protein
MFRPKIPAENVSQNRHLEWRSDSTIQFKFSASVVGIGPDPDPPEPSRATNPFLAPLTMWLKPLSGSLSDFAPVAEETFQLNCFVTYAFHSFSNREIFAGETFVENLRKIDPCYLTILLLNHLFMSRIFFLHRREKNFTNGGRGQS